LPEETAREVSHHADLTELFFVRRYAAKLGYELGFFEDPLKERRNRELYTATLSAATRFVYAPQNYLNDMDPGYYSADYLRAWITEAMLRRHLEDIYGGTGSPNLRRASSCAASGPPGRARRTRTWSARSATSHSTPPTSSSSSSASGKGFRHGPSS
jgi:hypothetical protein